MNYKELRRNIGLIILPVITRLICATLRIKVVLEKPIDVSSNYLFLFWHGTMTAPWYFNKNNNFAAVVSTSKDGEILCRTLRKWNYYLLRGSSNNDGKAVFNNIVDTLNKGINVALTPDGPKGEPLKMKIGALIASVRTQKRIYLCGVFNSSKIVFNSWDRFEMPLPFSRVILVVSSQEIYPQNLSRDEYEKIREGLETELNRLQSKAREIYGIA